LPDAVKFFFAWRLTYNAKLKLSNRELFMAGGGTEEKCVSCMVKVLLIQPLKSQNLFQPTLNIN
jgi:hypothetical protein